jgi:gamma-tubulin complex component 3
VNTAKHKVRSTIANSIQYSNLTLGRPCLSESLILRDTLYLLQGISGKHVQFSNSQDNQNTLTFVDDAVRSHPLCNERVC